jgi:hypothetical protein
MLIANTSRTVISPTLRLRPIAAIKYAPTRYSMIAVRALTLYNHNAAVTGVARTAIVAAMSVATASMT